MRATNPALPALVVAMMGWPTSRPSESKLIRSAFEAGVRYDDDALAAASSGCLADDWSVVIDWGDGSGSRPPSRRDAPQVACGGSGCVPQGGPYLLWSDHVYARPGTYPVRIEPRVHCFGAHGATMPYPALFRASVYERVPLRQVLLPQSVGPGGSATLRVQLSSPAPPSGTRVHLEAGPPGFVDGKAIPPFVDVPPQATEKVLQFVAPQRPGTLWIKATTVPSRPIQRNMRIQARP